MAAPLEMHFFFLIRIYHVTKPRATIPGPNDFKCQRLRRTIETGLFLTEESYGSTLKNEYLEDPFFL